MMREDFDLAKAPKLNYRLRRTLAGLIFLALTGLWVAINPASYDTELISETNAVNPAEASATDPASSETGSKNSTSPTPDATSETLASELLSKLEVKGRAPKTGYSRDEFYSGWPTVDGCNLRQKILRREFGDTAVMDKKDPCNVVAGSYTEPYTGEYKTFSSRAEIGKSVQIDHIVALSDAWQKGAQYMDKDTRYKIATDPLNLIAADASANMTKSDGDAATWLPSNKKFRCQYVARQVSVKYKYDLWVTEAERDAIARVLSSCPSEPAPGL